MHAKTIEHMFSFPYKKTAAEIVEKMKAKILVVQAKIEERQKRLADLRREYQIDDSDLVQLLTAARKNAGAQRYTYSKMSNTTLGGGGGGMEEKSIGAGVVNNLLTESDFIEAERDQVKRMEMIVRNLKPIPAFASGDGTLLPEQSFSLDHEELEYLGF